MQSHDTAASANLARNRRTLWLILLVCAAPIIASYLAYLFWAPTGRVNYGDLIEARAMPDTSLAASDGSAFRFSELKGQWVLLTSGTAACDTTCRQKLVYMRQVRLAQSKESARIERVWLLTDTGMPEPALVAEHPGLRIIRGAEIAATLPAVRAPADHIYVVDPLGHLMMRFPADPDPRRILKDVSRLLRHSKWK
jgi:hypothetical protein